MMAENPPSETVLQQRIRNRIIEYLELTSSFESQRQCQEAVSSINVPTDVINMWRDCVRDDPSSRCPQPVFSPEEQQAVGRFDAAWNEVCDSTPQMMPPLDELFANPVWARLRGAAEDALSVFLRRGKFSEEIEVF